MEQVYDRVYIDPDVAASLSRPEDILTRAFGNEANIAYMGFTRAIRELYLPRDFKTILTPEWQETIEPTKSSSPRDRACPEPVEGARGRATLRRGRRDTASIFCG
jgi:hypothetical protein